ncbi:MAG TPA: hypothetical protein VF692_07985 [Pyrinomonadaceae bacterium]|jgi:hypothetical protein
MAFRVKFEIFRSGGIYSKKNLFTLAADFANLIGREQVINISHSQSENEDIVTVWYWTEEETNILGIKETK